MALTKRLVKGSRLTNIEGDNNLDFLNEATQSNSTTVLLDQGVGRIHADGVNFTNAFAEGTITVDLTGAVPNGWAEVYMNLTANPTITVTNGTSSVEYPNNDSVSATGDYYITIRRAYGKILVYIPSADSGGTTSPNAPTNLAPGTVTQTTIPLTWTKSTTGVMTEYRAYVGGVLQQTFTGDVAAGTLTGLTAGTDYNNITVRAFDGTTESPDSNSINETTASTELYETGTPASIGSEGASLGDWANNSGSALMAQDTGVASNLAGSTSTQSLRITTINGSSDRREYTFPITSGNTYTIGMDVLNIDCSNAGWYNWIGFSDFVATPFPIASPAGTWTRYEQTVTANVTGTGEIDVYAGLTTGGAGEVLHIDNVSIVEN